MLTCGVEVRGLRSDELEAALVLQASEWIVRDLSRVVACYAEEPDWRMATRPVVPALWHHSVSVIEYEAIEVTFQHAKPDDPSLISDWSTISTEFGDLFGRSLDPREKEMAPFIREEETIGTWPADLSPGFARLFRPAGKLKLKRALALREADPDLVPAPAWCESWWSHLMWTINPHFEHFRDWMHVVRGLQSSLFGGQGAPDHLLRILFWTH